TPCRCRRVAALLPAALLLIGAARAQEADPARLDEIQQQIEVERGRADSLESQSKALSDEVAALRQKLIAAARTAQDSEDDLSEIEDTLAAREAEATGAEAELGDRRGQLAAILGALQRLALQPPEAMLLGPATPLDTVRGATLLRVALPAVEGRARALKTELESLRSLQAEIDERRQALATATTRLDGERREL